MSKPLKTAENGPTNYQLKNILSAEKLEKDIREDQRKKCASVYHEKTNREIGNTFQKSVMEAILNEGKEQKDDKLN